MKEFSNSIRSHDEELAIEDDSATTNQTPVQDDDDDGRLVEFKTIN